MAHACIDCVEIHGDKPDEWLKKWPEGAEFRKDFGVFLCDGCADERRDDANVEDPWRDGVYDDPFCY